MKNVSFTLILIGLMLLNLIGFSQIVADFENLTVPSSGYYDGGVDHSGTVDATEFFTYSSNGVILSLNSTVWDGGWASWAGMAFSNQTDLTTPNYLNYSAYSNPAGGNNNSSNYGLFYPSWGVSDSVSFEEPADLEGMYITNYVWTYHYIMGSDGSGTGTFENGDYLNLVITAFNDSDEQVGEVITALADFTSTEPMVINEWTWVDLSELDLVKYIKFYLTSSDPMAPTYFCVDDITFTTSTSIEQNETNMVDIFPNPCAEFVVINNIPEQAIQIEICDISGKIVNSYLVENTQMRIYTTDLPKGTYLLRILTDKEVLTRKFMK